jgi:P-type conjugative transfer protein TrbJ
MKFFLKINILFLTLVMPITTHAMMPVIDLGAITQLMYQLSQLKTQTEYISTELKQLKGNQYQWSDAQGVINNLGSVIQQTNGISYNASNIDSQFRKAYPGYKAPENFSDQYKNNSEMTLNTLNGVLQSVGTNARDFQDENTRLKFLQAQSQSAQGQTQAIQAASQIASETVSQIQLLRQTVIAQTNAQTTYYATNIQNEASSRAELEEVISAGSTTVPAYGSSGHSLNPPE